MPRSAPSLFQPSLSPDARQIAFASGGSIWTVPARGGSARLLVSDGATDERPIFSPDGREIAYVSSKTGNGDVYVLKLRTAASGASPTTMATMNSTGGRPAANGCTFRIPATISTVRGTSTA